MKRACIALSLLMLISLNGCKKVEKEDEKAETNTIEVQEDVKDEKTEESMEKEDDNKEDNIIQSDDLYSYEIIINGQHYKLPCKYSEIKEAGWVLTDDETTELNPDSYGLTGAYLGDTDNYMGVSIINLSNDVKQLKDCYVGYISIDFSYDKNKDIDILLPQGITIGSTIDEVEEAYGEQTSDYEGEYYSKYTYEAKIYKNVEFTFDVEDKKLMKIEMRNFVDEPSDIETASNSTTNDNEVLEVDYTAPTELGDDLLSFNVKYEGVLYNVPIPVSELENNGWVIEKAPVDKIQAKGSQGGFKLRKDNNTLTTRMYNPHDTETSINNCLVTTIITDNYDSKFDLEMPKGITVGATESDIISAYGETNLEKEESSNIIYYSYKKSALEYVTFIMKKEDKVVYKIEVENEP